MWALAIRTRVSGVGTDNPDLYRALYVAASASGAIGETFTHLSAWSRAMLPFPAIDGAERVLGVYSLDQEVHPLLDLDEPRALLDRGVRPTDIVVRNHPQTQQIAPPGYPALRDAGHLLAKQLDADVA